MTRWTLSHAALMLLGLLVWLQGADARLLALIPIISLLVYWLALPSDKRFCFSWADAVTAFRLLIVVSAMLASQQMPLWLLAVGFFCALLLDGLDGYLARKFNAVSDTGQLFDVEVDAFSIFLLAVLLIEQRDWPLALLLVGVLRYAYLILLWLLVRELRWEPRRRYASVIAVIVYLALVINLLADTLLFKGLLIIACVALLLSFYRSLSYQLTSQDTGSGH